MLRKLDAATVDRAPRPDQGSVGITPADVMLFARLNAPMIAALTGLGLLAALLYVMTKTPIYMASAQVVIDAKPAYVLRDQVSEGALTLDTPQIENQIAIIRSEALLEKVAMRLGLVAERRSAAAPSSSLSVFMAKLLGRTAAVPTEAAVSRAVAAELQGGLEVTRVGLSHVLQISYRSTSPATAALIANAIAEAYVRDQLDIRSQVVRQGAEWLEARIEDLRRQLNTASAAVQEFKARRDYRLAPQQGRETPQPRGEGTTLEELETRAYTFRKLYESYLQAYAESVQRESFPVSGARIIATASPPAGKSSPRTLVTLAVGTLAGLMGGLGLALIRHNLDDSIRTPRQIRSYLGLECLAEIPHVGEKRDWAIVGLWRAIRRRKEPESDASGIVDGDPADGADADGSEVVRLERTNSLLNRLRSVRSLAVVSVHRGAGGSSIAANLARLYHANGRRVLLIDADARQHDLTRRHALKSVNGLLDVARREASLVDTIVPGDGEHPPMLPLGRQQGPTTIDAMITPSRIAELLSDFKADNELVVFDLPAMRPFADGLVIAAQVDAALVVVEWGKTGMREIEDTLHELRVADTRIAGIVLNKAAPHTLSDLLPEHLRLRLGLASRT